MTGPQLTARLEQLERENRILTHKSSGSLANNLCPDHRDKQAGKTCLACEIERLQRENAELRSRQGVESGEWGDWATIERCVKICDGYAKSFKGYNEAGYLAFVDAAAAMRRLSAVSPIPTPAKSVEEAVDAALEKARIDLAWVSTGAALKGVREYLLAELYSIQPATAEGEHAANQYRVLWEHALKCVDRVFQECTENPNPILPDFALLGSDKFESVIRLAEEYKKALDSIAELEGMVEAEESRANERGRTIFELRRVNAEAAGKIVEVAKDRLVAGCQIQAAFLAIAASLTTQPQPIQTVERLDANTLLWCPGGIKPSLPGATETCTTSAVAGAMNTKTFTTQPQPITRCSVEGCNEPAYLTADVCRLHALRGPNATVPQPVEKGEPATLATVMREAAAEIAGVASQPDRDAGWIDEALLKIWFQNEESYLLAKMALLRHLPPVIDERGVIERCAKVCEKIMADHPSWSAYSGCELCADEIRKLPVLGE